MKRIKKLVSVMLAMVMAFAMTMTAFAENSYATPNTTKHTITIYNEKEGHTYEAYQVFRGDYFKTDVEGEDGKNTSEKLSNITWGSGVDGDALLTALQSNTKIGGLFESCKDAESVADVVAGLSSANLDVFADVVAGNLTDEKFVGTEGQPFDSVYSIEVEGDGYYLVMDKPGSLDDATDAYTKYIMQVVGNMDVKAKAQAPTLEKKIVDADGNEIVANQGFIGDVIQYKLTSNVPDTQGYDEYTFRVHDEMSVGLTFNDDVIITIGGDEIDASSYTITSSGLLDGCTLEIAFDDFLNLVKTNSYAVGTEITVTYSATINEKAVAGNAGNSNTAYLEYSKNPNNPGDDPNPGNVTGKTPDKTVTTYVAGIQLKKIDSNTQNPLPGAKFELKGFTEKIVLVNEEYYKKDEFGTYYRLKDGTYTTQPPVSAGQEGYTEDQYESTDVKYKKIETVTKETEKIDASVEGWVDENGVLTFTGLGEGEYTITELIAPDGYNKLDAPIKVVITWHEPSGGKDAYWTAQKDSDDEKEMDASNTFCFEYEVENKSGSLLPSTGGIGTTIFYVVGAVLVIGAGILLVTKRRMKAQ